ncbi:MAG TPA: ATP-dependent DNA ligase [Longimicrobium sp.]
MNLPISTDFPVAESEQWDELPTGDEWQYEPKWDGFRCLAFRDGDEVELRSKAGKPLGRYFPDVVDALRGLTASRFVLDGEIVVPMGDALSFEELQLRLHPAASRVNKLAAAHPAIMVGFDLLLGARGGPLTDRPLRERREKLEAFAGQFFGGAVRLSPASCSETQARAWLEQGERGLDGVMAKRLDLAYLSGERTGMVKIKNVRTVDCVVGGFRYAQKEPIVGSLLLGLFDEQGLLNHVGFCSAMSREEREALTPRLEALRGLPGFTGSAPGGPSRWTRMNERSTEWESLAHELVVEVGYDHMSGGRFRHGTKFVRWRPDKAPEQCTYAQLGVAGRSSLRLLAG